MPKSKITGCNVRMYTMGTGDCFVLSFKNEDRETLYQLMIDCGVINIKGAEMEPYAKDIIEHTEGEVDALLITHEHQDHVLGFQRAEQIFVDHLKINELWLPWTENTNLELVKNWREEYGKKKKALLAASKYLKESSDTSLFEQIYGYGPNGKKSLEIRKSMAGILENLTCLNIDTTDNVKKYAGDLVGMNIIKEKLFTAEPRYLDTGQTLDDIAGLDNVRIYILGPPAMWTDVKKEHGKDGQTYKHNTEIELVRSFSSLPFEDADLESCPFNKDHIKVTRKIKQAYTDSDNDYRRIDYDWLMSAGNLALRLTRGINNLSAVLAIEFIDSGKVMLFPGDAEYGSWKSWHEINWTENGRDGSTHLTTDLLNRTVFYKVAHHMSHNGTARELGLDLMTSKTLVAMATLDYGRIGSKWTNTMPNRGLLRDLIEKTKGRIIFTDTKNMFSKKDESETVQQAIDKKFATLSNKRKEEFKKNYKRKKYFVDYYVDGN